MPWSMVVLIIVVMSLSIPLYALHVKSLRRRTDTSERDEQVDRELATLRDRVETLERIVTDRRYGLDREFERL